MTLLRVQDLSASYGKIPVISKFSFELDTGKLLAIEGRNGVGKSTVLRCIAGLHATMDGEIFLGKDSIYKKQPHEIVRLGITMVPEGRRLFPNHSVLENIQLGGFQLLRNGKTDEFLCRLKKTYQLFPFLKDRDSELARKLSGGEQQMVAIARALIMNPKVLLVDEPFLGLAPKIVKDIMNVFKKLATSGTSILVAEETLRHSVSFDNIIEITQGSILGTTADSGGTNAN